MNQAEGQQLYDECGGFRLAGQRLGISLKQARTRLLALGVRPRPRGNAVSIGRRAIVTYQCVHLGRPCVIRDLESCQTCLAEHTLDSVCAGASSSWIRETVGVGQ